MPGAPQPKPLEVSLMPPPPFGTAPVGSRSRASLVRAASADLALPSQFQQPSASILKPTTGRDVVALIFLLLVLPQGISCIVLTSYILLGSFRSMAGKLIAKIMLKLGDSVKYDLDVAPSTRYRYYLSELVGEFLRLFSMNSIILLVCHYTLPRACLQYLTVMAKSIIASRLVGTYATGSTTYVSVVSNSVAATTTTTTTTGQSLHQGSKDSRYLSTSFFNSLLGFTSVCLINHFINNWVLDINMSTIVSDVAALCGSFPFSRDITLDGLFRVLFTKSPFLVSYHYLSAKKGNPYLENRRGRAGLLSRLVIHVCIKYFHLGDKSVQTLAFVMKEGSVVLNYAYLVLCIHVISLTIVPFLKSIVFFKFYSRTLDHLSSLTPDVPYGGFRKNGMISTIPAASDSVVVINVEPSQLLLAATSTTDIPEIKVDEATAKLSPQHFMSSASSVPADNFKVFCTVPPTSKSTVFGNIPRQSKTIVDRKRSNSNAAASTTIMDRYFTVSIQPIWSWLAAIKILAWNPRLFAGSPTKLKNGGGRFVCPSVESDFKLAVARVDESRVIFRVLDRAYMSGLTDNEFHVRVNNVDWPFVFLHVGEEAAYISVHSLTPLYQYEISFFNGEDLVGNHLINTVSRDPPHFSSFSMKTNAKLTLQSSLKYSIATVNDVKANVKKSKKDENKRVAELKKQIDSLQSRIDKYGNKDLQEGRVGAKLKGLQNAVSQLENEIKEIQQQIDDYEASAEGFEANFRKEEKALTREIAELEEFIKKSENKTTRLKTNIKSVEGDKNVTEVKRKKMESKVNSRREDIARLNSEIKAMKKALLYKIQKRQRKIHERFETILPKVSEASDNLTQELEEAHAVNDTP